MRVIVFLVEERARVQDFSTLSGATLSRCDEKLSLSGALGANAP